MPHIDRACFVAPNATIIGDVHIEAGSSVWFSCVLRGDVNSIRVGRDTNIQDGSVLHVGDPPYDLRIGNEVLIGHLAMIHGCTIEDGAFIGMTTLVLDGAVVEAGAVVAAGSLVAPRQRVTAGKLWAGRPARPLRELTDRDLAMRARGAAHYVELGREYRSAASPAE